MTEIMGNLFILLELEWIFILIMILNNYFSAPIVLLVLVDPETEIVEDFLQIHLLEEEGGRDREAEAVRGLYLLIIVEEEDHLLQMKDVEETDHLQDPLFVPGPDH